MCLGEHQTLSSAPSLLEIWNSIALVGLTDGKNGLENLWSNLRLAQMSFLNKDPSVKSYWQAAADSCQFKVTISSSEAYCDVVYYI